MNPLHKEIYISRNNYHPLISRILNWEVRDGEEKETSLPKSHCLLGDLVFPMSILSPNFPEGTAVTLFQLDRFLFCKLKIFEYFGNKLAVLSQRSVWSRVYRTLLSLHWTAYRSWVPLASFACLCCYKNFEIILTSSRGGKELVIFTGIQLSANIWFKLTFLWITISRIY